MRHRLALLTAVLASLSGAELAQAPYAFSDPNTCAARSNSALINAKITGLTAPGISNLGNEGDWLDRALGFPVGPNTSNTLNVVSNTGGTAALFATRTSDNPTLNGGQIPAVNIFAFNEASATSGANSTYGIYLETRNYNATGFTQGVELNSTDYAPTVMGTPYAMTPGGYQASLTLSTGRHNVFGTETNPTMAMGILGTTDITQAGFNSGIVFEAGAIRGANAIDLPRGLQIHWGSLAGANSFIRSDATSSARGAGMVFTDTGIVFQDYKGTAMLNVTPTQTTLGEGNLAVPNEISTGALVESQHTPASSSEACKVGQIANDAKFFYACVAANTWKRAALSSF